MTVSIAQGLYVWTLTLEDGTVRTNLGATLDSVGSGNFPSPIVSATRGPAFTGDSTPVVTALNPTTAKHGDPDVTLHVVGTGFGPYARVVVDGVDAPTTFVSPTELTTVIPTSQLAVGGKNELPVFVRSLAGEESNALTFTITAVQEEPS